MCVAFRKHGLLSFDDYLYSPGKRYRILVDHLYVSCLRGMTSAAGYPRNECKEKREKKQLKQYPIGYFYVDISEVRSEEGKLYLFVAIDRTSKFAYVELVKEHGKLEAAQLLKNLMKPYYTKSTRY